MPQPASRVFRTDRFVVDLTRRTLHSGGSEVALRPRSFSVLALLIERAGDVVSREAFFENVWAGLAVSDESLSRCISDVRAALDDRDQRLVKTVPGRGYLLAWPKLPPGASEEVPAAETVAAAAAALLPGDEGPSLAVLPFLNLSGRPDEEFVADGFTEDITSALSRVRGIVVIARSTMFGYKGQPVDVRALAGELRVRYVLEGSVRKVGQRLRVSAQLVESASGKHLWAENYDRVIDELFAIQDEIATQIAGRIGPQVLLAEFGRSARKPSQDLSAWECVIRALYHSSQQSDGETRTALALLQQALQHDPAHAQALGMMAWLMIFRAFQGWEEMPVALARAEELIARSLAIDREELWPYLAQGMVGFAVRDNERSMAALERAVAISPSSVNAHGLLGVAHAFGGRGAAALAEIRLAVRLSPRDTYLSDFELYHAFAYFQAADYVQALRYADAAQRLRPGHPYPVLMAAASAGQLGHLALANEMAQRLRSMMPMVTGAWAEATTPYVHAADRQRLVEGLVRAGLPADMPGPDGTAR